MVMRCKLVCYFIVCCMLSAAVARAETWQAGAAKINITPEEFICMSGYGGRDEPATGKVTDLWAKAVVINDPQGQRAVIITLDLVGIDRTLSVDICESLAAEYRLERRFTRLWR